MATHFHKKGEAALKFLRTTVVDLNWRKLALMGCLLLATYVLFTHAAYAQNTTGGTVDYSREVSKCQDYPGITNKIAACIRLTLMDVADIYFDGFYRLVQYAIGAFTTLYIVVYGVMAAMGMLEKVGRDTFVFLIKLSMVAYFSANIPMIYKWDMDLMDAAASAVVKFIPQSGPSEGITEYSQIKCLQSMTEGKQTTPQEGNPVVGPWLAMDCVIDSVIGIKKEDVQNVAQNGVDKAYNDALKGNGMARGMLRFFFSSMQSSVIGMLIAILGFIFIYGLMFLIIKSLFTYLGGYIAITFLMIFGPLFIPLALFRVTKEYFDKWVKVCISMTLQPVIILIFVVFSVSAVDLAMFSGEYSVFYRIAGEATRGGNFNLNEYLDQNQVVIAKPTKVALQKYESSPGCGTVQEDAAGTANPIVPLSIIGISTDRQGGGSNTSACKDAPIQFYRDSIDWKKLAEARGKAGPPVTLEGNAERIEQQMSREVLSAVIFAGIVIFLMNGLLAMVPAMANDLTGDFGVSPDLYTTMGSKLPGQAMLSRKAKGLSDQLGALVTGRK